MNYEKDRWKSFIPENFKKPETPFDNSGVLLVDKPAGISSMDALRYIKLVGSIKKAGHGGTLDPFATGLLVVLLNKATKLSEKIMKGKKEYEGAFLLGKSSDTQDITGVTKTETEHVPDFSTDELQKYADKFTGSIVQTPPIFSAKKVGGKPLYKHAREGTQVKINEHHVFVEEFKITEKQAQNRFSYHIKCGKGTYVRTLIHDLGRVLNLGGLTESLRRITTQNFSVKNAHTLNNLLNQEQIKNALIPLDKLNLL